MRYILPILALFILSNCTKTEVSELAVDTTVEEKVCELSGQAVVQLMRTNADGSEDFYYLEFIGTSGNVGQTVFPQGLPSNYKAEGEKIEIQYRATGKKTSFIVCLPGHTIDPDNPDYRTMATIEICETKPLN